MRTWDSILTRLRTRFREQQFNIWFRSMSCAELTDTHIVLSVPNQHYCDWISANFLGEIETAVEDALGGRRNVKLIVQPDEPLNGNSQGLLPLEHELAKPSSNGGSVSIGLKPDYTFDNFVVGPSNQFAHAAALAVAERPAENYNPLFIYGGVGVGKTHLMCAIGHAVQERRNLRVAYLTSEQFMNELITSIERREMAAFRERYRTQCDVLLIDDIQFIAGKERTQEEFFHTFNTLHNNLKQIVLTSDKSPQEIAGLEERLQSRFNWGLIADVQRPEFETRVAILKKKAAYEGIDLPEQVGIYMANHIDSNIRELEGCLKRMTAHAKLRRQALSIELAKEIMAPFLRQRAANLNPDRILRLVASYFNLKVSDIKGRARVRQIAYPRQLAMYLARKHTNLSFPELGRSFVKDHSTIINAFQKIENLLLKDLAVKGDIEALERNLLA